MHGKISYCGQLVKNNDPDRFLLSLFAPPHVREDLWALFAFNHEIAKTREVVSESRLGLIRLQWWREAIGKIYDRGDVPEHEILKALGTAIKIHNLPRENFDTLIYAREFDLENVMPANIEGLYNYADFTSTPLMKLAVRITGGDAEYEPVQPVAVNYALMGILRAVPFHARDHRCYLPEDLMKKYDVTRTRLCDFLDPGPGMVDIVRDVCAQFVPRLKTGNRFLRASQALAAQYHRQVRAYKYDVFHPRVALPPAFRELRLALSAYAL